MFKSVHDEDGEAQAEDVGQEAGVEIGLAVLLQATHTKTHVSPLYLDLRS